MSLYLDMAVDLYTHYTYWKFLPGAFPAWEISCSKTGTEGYQPFFQLRRIKGREDSSHSINSHCLPLYIGILLKW